MKHYHFKDGEDVAHKEYLCHKMIVRRAIKKKVMNPVTKKDMEKFIGLECAWWEGSDDKKIYKWQVFHSRELVPWSVAVKGQEEVTRWLTGDAGSYYGQQPEQQQSAN